MTVALYDHHTSICSQMARLVLVEKGVRFTRRAVNISADANEQFEPWYTALNARAVVPTLMHDETVVTDTLRICDYVDAVFSGPALTPSDPEHNRRWMEAIMAPHYGVLLYGPINRGYKTGGVNGQAVAAADPSVDPGIAAKPTQTQ